MNKTHFRKWLPQMLALHLCFLLATTTVAGTAHIAQPWRSDAVVLGRDEAYNKERFLHELSYRHRTSVPGVTDNGIRATAGSVSSRRLYHDFRFRQDFGFRDNQNGFLLDVQRGEDLDGAYQRQLVGFRQNLGEQTEVWLQGDVFSDKAESDIYFSARHHLTERSWVHASWILPDYYFNDKTETSDRISRTPQSYFLQWHRQGTSSDNATTVSTTLSPDAGFISRQQALTVHNKSLKAAFTHQQRAGDWLFSWHMEGERTRRDYWLQGQNENQKTGFERDYFHARAAGTLASHTLSPSIGVAWLQLDETGFFGRELNDQGRIRRREPTVFGEITLRASANTTLSPGIYLSTPDIQQQFEQHPGRRDQSVIGKLALPIDIRLAADNQAVLTVNPTVYLHKAAFGGGNLQLHWPL